MSTNTQLINVKKALLYYCLPIAFICFLILRYIVYGTTLRLVGDEFGYWNAAAYFAGLDWSEVASINNYYGYGYALFLAPILKLPILPETRYLIAQLLNIALLCCIFIMISYVIRKLMKLSDAAASLLALALTLYQPNTTYTLYNLTESLILFLFWAIVTLLTEYVYKNLAGENASRKPAFELYASVAIGVYSYTVHQRTVIVTAVCFLTIVFIIILRQSDIKSKLIDFIIVCAVMAALLLIASYLKKDFQTGYLTIKDNADIVNDFGHEVSKLGWIWSAKGMKKFFVSAFGKLFNLQSTSYLFFILIVFDFFKDVYSLFKTMIAKLIKKDGVKAGGCPIGNMQIIRLFITTCLLASLGMETFSLFNYEWRYDLLIYGRYTDLFMSAAFLIMVIDIIELKEQIVIPCTISAFLYTISCVLTITHIPQLDSYGNAFISAISLYDMFLFGIRHLPDINPLYLIIVKTILGSIAVCIAVFLANRLPQPSKNAHSTIRLSIARIIPTLIACAFIFYNSLSFYYQQMLSQPSSNEVLMADINAAEMLRESGYADKLNYLVGYYDMIYIDNIQFLLPDHTIKCHKEPAVIDDLSDEAIITSIDSIHAEELTEKGFTEFIRGTSTIVWLKE